MQLSTKFLNRETHGAGPCDDFAHQLVQPALPLDLVAFYLLPADEGTGPLLSLQHTADFQLAISAHNRIRIDGEVHRQLAHSRKLIARLQHSRSHAAGDLVDNLAVDRHAALDVQAEGESPSDAADRCGHLEL